jgi:hypothetical protein
MTPPSEPMTPPSEPMTDLVGHPIRPVAAHH